MRLEVLWERGRVWALIGGVLVSASACAKDVVLPDQKVRSVCGDGIVGPTEECDVESPGCTDCLASPGYTCEDNHCFIPCGDGIEGDGPTCSNPHRTDECDMTGYWISRETDFTRDAVLNQVQTSSTWFVYRFSQSGSRFQVEEEIHCGIHVTGSATVDYTEGTLRGLMYENNQTPNGEHGPRRGTSVREGDGCRFSFDRWYNIRGGTADLLPKDFESHPSLASLVKLPSVPDPLNPPKGPIPGTTDPDGDGYPGAAYQITSLVSGVRNSVQRDQKQYATISNVLVPRNALEFAVPGEFNLQRRS